jgi:hypothetical protein
VQQRKTRQVGQLVPVHVIFKVPQLQPVGVERLPLFGAAELGTLQPAEAFVQIRQMLEVWPIWRAGQELRDLSVAGRLPAKNSSRFSLRPRLPIRCPNPSLSSLSRTLSTAALPNETMPTVTC